MGPCLDTSARAKWYLNEPSSQEFEAFIQEQPTAAIRRLSVVEFRCLLARFPLRTLDALHLAIAQGIHCRLLATADRTMADAGKAAGLGVARFF